MKNWAYRFTKTGNSREIELILARRRARIMYTPSFDRRGTGSRAVFTASIDLGKYHYSAMFQHYREGYELDSHTDGVAENKVITILLKRPREGGDFYVDDGSMQSYLGGRIVTFDGGRHEHGVTKITKGSRTILMLQRGRWRL